jgi:hypothetical protein
MALAVVEEIVALLGLVSKVVLCHSAESRESKHSKGTGQTGNSSATRLDRALEKLSVNVLHILKKGDERVLLRGGCNDTSLGQHVLLAARLEFHLVHEVLNAGLVKDTIRINEEHEKVVVALEVLGVNLVNELEGPLLAVALASVGETGDGDATATVDDVDGLGVGIESQRDTELLNSVEVEFALLVSVKGQEDVQAGRGVFAVDERVASSEQNLGNLLVTRHDDDDLGGRGFVKHSFDPPGAANRVCDELVDAEQPGDCQKTSEGPESEPLEEIDHLLGEVLDNLSGQRQCNDHDGQEDGTTQVSVILVLFEREKTYRSKKKRIPKKTDKIRTLTCSAFWKTLTRQYVKAATQRNHSRRAASMTPPTIAT